jgi:hypothetical protein
MQQTIRTTIQARSTPRTSRFKIPRLLFTVILLVIAFLLAILAVSTLSKRLGDTDPADLFAPYNDIFPGQRVDVRQLEEQGFTCKFDSQPTPADESIGCSRDLQTETFTYMSAVIWDGIVQRLTFAVREHSLMLGHLTLLWGAPETINRGNSMNVIWITPGKVISTGQAPQGVFNYFQPISVISFEIAA